MTRRELVEKIAGESKMTKSDVSLILEKFLSLIKSRVADNDAVTLRSFGSFQQITRKERNFHYAPGKYKLLPKHNEPIFKPSQAFKDLIK